MDEEELILHTAQDLPDHDARGMKRIGTISKAGRIHNLFMDPQGKVYKDTFDLQAEKERECRKQFITGLAAAGAFPTCARSAGKSTDQGQWRRHANGLT